MSQPYPPHGPYRPQTQQWPTQQPPAPQQPWQPAPPPVQRRRRIWPWFLLAIVLVPVLTVVSCTALFGAAVNGVNTARQGGTVPIGHTFTYQDGTQVTVSDIAGHKVSNPYILDRGEVAYQGTVTVVNGTKNPLNTIGVSINATVGGVQADRVFDGVTVPNQDLAPGQAAKILFQFKTKQGVTGALQVSVTAGFNEPVFFTGSIK